MKRYLTSVKHLIPVSVHLELVDDKICRLRLKDGDGQILHKQEIQYTAELISLLRWPQTHNGGMFTNSSRFVTWNIFEDIHYGELDFIAPYVSFKAARRTPTQLPERISQFFEDIKTIHVGIEHDEQVCPITLGEEINHGACWRITLPQDVAEAVRKLLGHHMTGEEVNGLLAPERVMADQLYKLKLTIPEVSETDPSIVFHEERYIRILLRQHDFFLRILNPGTYLHVQEQRWVVDVHWEEDGYAIWSAISITTGLPFKSERTIIPLTCSQNAEEECTMILGVITEEIPNDRIIEYDILKDRILTKLRSLGYTTRPPSCEWRMISTSDKRCVFGLFQIGKSGNPIIMHEYNLKPGLRISIEDLIDQYQESMSDAEKPDYHIINTDAFHRKLARWLKSNQAQEVVEEADDV